MSFLIKLDSITKTYYDGARAFSALKSVDFSLSHKEMVAIMGTSGSGKSTLMNIIGFLDRSTSGTYTFNQQNVSMLQENALAKIRNEKIGFVFQSFFLLPRLNALNNVMLPLLYRNVETNRAVEKSLQVLKKFGMENMWVRKPNELSGGQQQRVALARAMVGDPDIILADEPTGSLDSKTSGEVMELFLQLNKEEQRTIIIVTHDAEIAGLCQRTVVIKDGVLIP